MPDLDLMIHTQMEDSKEWFPYLHTGDVDLLSFYTHGICGEVGEFANNVKKLQRLQAERLYHEKQEQPDADYLSLLDDRIEEMMEQVHAEHIDILCYWMNLSAVMGTDPGAEYRANRAKNAIRFGG